MKGHIRERSAGHWAIVIDGRDPQTGERKRRWHSFAGTKREAQVRCAQLIAEAQGGATVDPSRITLAQYLNRFERDWVSLHTTVASAQRYTRSLAYARRHLGNRRLQALRPADLAALYATLSRAGLAPRTVKHAHNVLHRALEQARLWGLLRDNPAEMAKPPSIPDEERAILQPESARDLLERLRGQPLYLLASLALATGLRRSEALALRWRDVDLDAGRLTVEQALEQTATHGIRTKGPKTRHGRRTISLPAHIVAELRSHWRAQQEQRLALGMGKSPLDGFVLAAIDGRPQSPDAISTAWGRAMDEIGMPEITLHSLRHTHASMLIAAGVDILTISRRLGHANPTITLSVYGHLIHGTDNRAAQIMDQVFGNGSKRVADSGGRPENTR
jgi:integrase